MTDLDTKDWTDLFPFELPALTVACWKAPIVDSGLGVIANVSLYDPKTYRGPSADLRLVAPGDEGELPSVVAAVKERLEALRGDEAAQTAALDRPVAETLGLEAVAAGPGTFAPSAESSGRRMNAFLEATRRYEGVAEHFRELYGLRLPRHVAVWAALLRSLTELEARGLDWLGRSASGIMLYFEDGGLERPTREGLDGRLEMRFRRDPPEFVTIMHGDSDGLHYGLWYDDPAELPSGIAGNWARDSAETHLEEAPTAIQLLAEQLRERIEEPDYPEDPIPLSAHAVRAAVEHFVPADREAWEADGVPRFFEAERGAILGGIAPALPPEAGDPRAGWDAHGRRYELYRDAKAGEVAALVATAREELADGKPAFALVLGRELHWFDDDRTRDEALALLKEAYGALGRDALASIAEVHHAHRDLRSVGVYERG